MQTLSLGPLALPAAPLLLLAGVGGAGWLAERLARRRLPAEPAQQLGNTVWWAALGGLLVARLVHVAGQWDLYLAQPLALLDIRDGGWHAPSGALAGLLGLLWRGWRLPQAGRQPLAAGVLAGVAAWGSATLALGVHQAPALPSLSLVRLDGGGVVPLSAQVGGGQPTVLNLWASWCRHCRAEMPVLAAAQQREAGRVRIVFVNQWESAEVARAYLSAQGLTLREVMLDETARLGPALGSRGLPTTVFFDARGQLVDRHVGELTEVALKSKLRVLGLAAVP